jgi:hypothetical protein
MTTADPTDGPRDARNAKQRFGEQLLANPDVHGVGVGRRQVRGENTDEYAVVVHLQRELPRESVPPPRLVPPTLRFVDDDGRQVVVRVDVQEHGIPTPEIARVRPVPGGVSIGRSGTSGTLGGWVWDSVTEQIVALSNAHIFGSIAGRALTQPSHEDGGLDPVDRIATVLRTGSLDAAIAVPTDRAVIDASIIDGGQAVFRTATATLDMRIQKSGRGTGLTHGVVQLIDFDSDHGSHADLWIDGDGSDFSNGGDSGALYLASAPQPGPDESPRVVGLHWGGSGNDGVGHRIEAVFAELGLTTLQGHLD